MRGSPALPAAGFRWRKARAPDPPSTARRVDRLRSRSSAPGSDPASLGIQPDRGPAASPRSPPAAPRKEPLPARPALRPAAAAPSVPTARRARSTPQFPIPRLLPAPARPHGHRAFPPRESSAAGQIPPRQATDSAPAWLPRTAPAASQTTRPDETELPELSSAHAWRKGSRSRFPYIIKDLTALSQFESTSLPQRLP